MGSSPQQNYHQMQRELILLEQVCNMAASSLTLLIKMWQSMKCPFESKQDFECLDHKHSRQDSMTCKTFKELKHDEFVLCSMYTH